MSLNSNKGNQMSLNKGNPNVTQLGHSSVTQFGQPKCFNKDNPNVAQLLGQSKCHPTGTLQIRNIKSQTSHVQLNLTSLGHLHPIVAANMDNPNVTQLGK